MILDDTSRLLLRCLAGDVRPGDLPGSAEAGAWDRLLARAHKLGMAPLLYRQLQDHLARVPAPVRNDLQRCYWATAATNTLLLIELQRIVETLAARQVPAVLLKGAVLAETVYPDVGTRPMADLDLLVPPGQVDDAQAVLARLGYRAAAADHLGHTANFLRTYGGELTYCRNAGRGVSLDLHWRLIHLEGFRDVLSIGYDGLWQRVRAMPEPWQDARQLSVEDSILYLAIHLALHHRLSDFRLFFDVDRLIRAAGVVDWTALASRAAAWRVRYVTYIVLALAQELCSTPIPVDLRQAFRPSRLRLALLGQLVDGPRIVAGTLRIGSKGERLLHLLLTDRARDALRSIFRFVWPEPEWIVARYRLRSRRQVAWYRARHVLRMAWYGLLAAGQLLRSLLPARGSR
jgi:hypothetical protein